MADPVIAGVEQDAQKFVQFTEAQFAALIAVMSPKAAPAESAVKSFIAKVENEGKAVVADVKSINWSHVYAVIASTAALAMHFFKLPVL